MVVVPMMGLDSEVEVDGCFQRILESVTFKEEEKLE